MELTAIRLIRVTNENCILMKQGTRQGTAARGGTAYNGGLPVNLGTQAAPSLTNRPVTQQGLAGIKTAPQGSKRQVYDRSYYLNALRQKNIELASEIAMFKKRIDEISKEAGIYTQLEKTSQDLNKQVLSMEGTLADYNLAADKFRNRAKPEDIKGYILTLKYSNDRLRAELDNIFIERKRQEEEIREIEQELRDIADSAQTKLAEMEPEQRKEYDNLTVDRNAALQDFERCLAEFEELESKIDDQNRRLRMDQNRVRVMELKEEISKLEEKKSELDTLNDETNMSVPQLMERLTQKTKEHNASIKEMEARSRELKKALDNTNKKVRDIEAELKGDNQVTDESKQKFEALFAKEQQLDRFIESFPKLRSKELSEIGEKQQAIVQYLDNMSQSLNLIRAEPDAAMGAKIESDYRGRVNDQKNSEDTYKLVKGELENMQQVLEKLQNFDETGPQKIKALEQRLKSMKEDLDKFKNADEKKREMQDKRKQYQTKTKSIQEMVPEYRRKLADAESTFSQAKANLSAHPKYAGFIELEKRISTTENVIANWKNNLAQKSQEIDHEPFSRTCKQLASELNRALLR